jgi:hypothetical protein
VDRDGAAGEPGVVDRAPAAGRADRDAGEHAVAGAGATSRTGSHAVIEVVVSLARRRESKWSLTARNPPAVVTPPAWSSGLPSSLVDVISGAAAAPATAPISPSAATNRPWPTPTPTRAWTTFAIASAAALRAAGPITR